MKLIKSILLSLGVATALQFSISIQASEIPAYTDASRRVDEQEVKYLLDDSFANPFNGRGEEYWLSGWNHDVIGGSMSRPSGGDLLITDTSSVLPVTFEREIEPVTFGKGTLEMRMYFPERTNGAYWSLRSGKNNLFTLMLSGENIVAKGKTGESIVLRNHKFDWYYLKAEFDVDQKLVTALYIDGICVARNIPFITDISHIDNFVMGTTNESTGSFRMDYVKIHRGYKVNEFFENSDPNIPDDWSVSGSAKLKDHIIIPSKGSTVKKEFNRETRRTAAEFYVMPPEDGGGFNVSLNDGDKNIITISTTDSGFSYKTDLAQKTEFYTRMANVMYNFRIEADFVKGSADLYMNNRIVQENIAFSSDINGIDSVTLYAENDKGAGATGFKVYPVIEYSDYVPEPVVPEKDDIDVIMQMCPMWSEGYHFGYDFLNASIGRKPLIGAYDEASSEASDWNIKHMVEHGVDVRQSVWYRGGSAGAPMREYSLQQQYKAMQNAKYADKMKWYIYWENSSSMGGTNVQNTENFLKYVAPFWIEYYFKDPNYYKVNGRPVVGFYYYWTLSGDFGPDIEVSLNRFRQLCIDAGVGDPILLQAVGGTDYFQNLDAYGFDLQTRYHAGTIYHEELIKSNVEQRDGVVNGNHHFQTMPVVNPGFDDYAWGRSTGTLWDKGMLKTALEYMRDEYFKNANLPLGRKMLLLATWDEYAEGHYFAPTEVRGFDFLDAVRETFVGDDEHTDILPTDEQRDRFDNRYPSWREAKYNYENPFREYIPDDTYVKHSWDFDDNAGDWTVAGGISKLKDGCLDITAESDTMMLTHSEANFEISDISHIKIRLKNLSSANYATMWYTTNLNDQFNSKMRIYNHLYEYREDFVDVIYPTEKYPLDWRGVLNTLQIRFSKMGIGESMQIDSIEMYAPKQEEGKITLNINGYEQKTDSIKYGEENAMVPLRKLAWGMMFDDLVSYDAEANAVMYRSISDDKIVLMPVQGTEFAMGSDKYPSEGYYRVEDGTCYVSSKWAQLVYDMESYYDKETDVFYVRDKEVLTFERPDSERETIWAAEFDKGIEGFSPSGGMETSLKDGVMTVTAGGSDPRAENSQLAAQVIDCKKLKKFAVKTTTSTMSRFKIYFRTSTHNTLSEANAFYFDIPPSAESKEFVYDLSRVMNWDGNLTFLRFDIETSGAVLDIDYMRFYGDFESELSAEEIANRFESMEVLDDGYVWNFNINNTKDGWKFNKHIADIVLNGGQLSMKLIGQKSEMSTVGNVGVEADIIKNIKIRMKNAGKGKTAKLSFITEAETEYSADKSFEFDIKSEDIEGTEYIIDVTANEKWSGKIKGFSFAPSEAKGDIAIDYIKLSVN